MAQTHSPSEKKGMKKKKIKKGSGCLTFADLYPWIDKQEMKMRFLSEKSSQKKKSVQGRGARSEGILGMCVCAQCKINNRMSVNWMDVGMQKGEESACAKGRKNIVLYQGRGMKRRRKSRNERGNMKKRYCNRVMANEKNDKGEKIG